MVKISHYAFDEFPRADETGGAFIELTDPTGQTLFDYVVVNTRENSLRRSARITGRAALAGADFNGIISTTGDGKLTLRHPISS